MDDRELVYDQLMTKLYRGSLDLRLVDDVSLWNVNLPLSPRGCKSSTPVHDALDLRYSMYQKTSARGAMVLWFPAAQLHLRPYDPYKMSPWLPHSVILSGAHKTQVGLVFAKGELMSSDSSKFFLGDLSGRGMSSAVTVKHVLDEFTSPNQLVVDLFAYKTAILPIWCRRRLISYVGFSASDMALENIEKKLAQVELPGIQLGLPAI